MLSSIAAAYEQANAYDYAKSLYQQIVQDYPTRSQARQINARMDIQRTSMLSLIGSEDGQAFQRALDGLLTDYLAHRRLPRTLQYVAEAYESWEEYGHANTLYQQVIENYPTSGQARNVGLRLDVQRTNILALIKAGEYAAAEVAVQGLVADANENRAVPAVLCSAAEAYEKAGRYTEACAIYGQISQNYAASAQARWVRSRFDIARTNIISLMQSGDETAAQEAIDNLLEDFSARSRLPLLLKRIAQVCESLEKTELAQALYEQANSFLQQETQPPAERSSADASEFDELREYILVLAGFAIVTPPSRLWKS